MSNRAEIFKKSLPEDVQEFQPTQLFQEIIKSSLAIAAVSYKGSVPIPVTQVIEFSQALSQMYYRSEMEARLAMLIQKHRPEFSQGDYDDEEELSESPEFVKEFHELAPIWASNQKLAEMWILVTALEMLDDVIDPNESITTATPVSSLEEFKELYKDLIGDDLTDDEAMRIMEKGGYIGVPKDPKEREELEKEIQKNFH